MSRTATLVSELLPLRPQGFLIEYGNPNGGDVDLFAVVNEPVVMSWVLGVIDMHVLPTEECCRLVALFDPAVTEPLGSGRFVDGDRVLYEQMLEASRTAKPTHDAGIHLVRRSRAELARASAWLGEFVSKPTSRAAQGLFMAMSYSVSYAESARRILTDLARPLSFAELLIRNPLLSEIRSQLTAAKTGAYAGVEAAEDAMTMVEAAVAGIDLQRSRKAALSNKDSTCHFHTPRS
ncbi:MAG: hypothetical protein IT419_11405 [Planctomycetes bacterium]|nr:hypothetical protein [Planctomycetota bacterium]